MKALAAGGNTIKVLRTLKGLSQKGLAEATEIPPWRIWRLEQGVSPPRPEEIQRLWSALSSGESEASRTEV